MSESRKNRKYSNFKETQKRVILAKKDKDTTTTQQPKILLKTKDKEVPTVIASRDKSEEATDPKATAKDASQPEVAGAVPPLHQVQQMQTPLSLITFQGHVNSQAFDHVIMEQNTDFLVVGVIGTKGVGKSTILNLLLTDADKMNVESIFKDKEGVFKTRSKKPGAPATEGIQLYVSGKDRIFFLDSQPQNVFNQLKKDYISNELDDLKMLIFLLSVCHVIIVVQDNVSPHFLRLLQVAEMMKLTYDKDGGVEHFPNVIFVKNRAGHTDFQEDQKKFAEKMYDQMFKYSKLKIHSGQTVNCFQFPEVNFNKPQFYTGHPDISSLIVDLQHRVFMLSSRPPLVQIQGPFTEKNWCQFCLSVWDTHNNNYFLRKYDGLKEKFNLHNHIHLAEVGMGDRDKPRERGDGRNDRDRGYLNFVDT